MGAKGGWKWGTCHGPAFVPIDRQTDRQTERHDCQKEFNGLGGVRVQRIRKSASSTDTEECEFNGRERVRVQRTRKSASSINKKGWIRLVLKRVQSKTSDPTT